MLQFLQTLKARSLKTPRLNHARHPRHILQTA